MEAEAPKQRKRFHRRRRPSRGQNQSSHAAVDATGQTAPQRTSNTLPLKSIDVGEADANAEYFMAKKAQRLPMYLRAYYEWNAGFSAELERGEKFLLHGQKGTGKTAVLRHLEHSSKEEYLTEFIVFRKEIVEEAQLANMAGTFSATSVIDEEKIKETKFYYHAMKRLLITLLLAKSHDISEEIPEEMSWFRKIITDIKSSSVGQIASLVTDSVIGSIESVQIDVGKATKGIAKVNPALAIKRSNDAFQKFAFSHFSKKGLKCRIFLDEMHFAFRDKQILGADAALVRDTVLAVREINEKLIESEIDSMIYMSIRSEFLEHQEIAVSDIAHTIESYGVEISWESAPYDRAHPMFFIALERLKLSLGTELTRDVMLQRYIPTRSIEDFLQYTWGKPRDIVRYFKSAKLAYGNSASIRHNEFGNVIRRYCQTAWQDVKAALTAFVPKNSLPALEDALQAIASRNFDNSVIFDRATLCEYLKPAYDNMRSQGVTYDISELIKLLYIVGVLYVRYRDASGQVIIHQFHRGNRHPASNAQYLVHRAVARAFS